MRKTRRKTSRHAIHFKISEPSRDTLFRTREYLLLLASLCAARVRYDAHELELWATYWTKRAAAQHDPRNPEACPMPRVDPIAA